MPTFLSTPIANVTWWERLLGVGCLVRLIRFAASIRTSTSTAIDTLRAMEHSKGEKQTLFIRLGTTT